MRFRKSQPSETPDGETDSAADTGPETTTDPTAALALAEAEAAAADATAAAARARAEDIRLLREASAELETDADATADFEPGAETVDDHTADADSEKAAAAEAPDATDPPGARRRLGPALRWVAATLCILLVGALVTVSVLMVVQHRKVDAAQRQESEYAAAARQGVVTLMSLDFTQVDENVKRIIENSTGTFRTEFESQAENFVTVAEQSKVITEATATAAAVESMTDNDAVVLVTATSKVTNASGARQDPRSWRMIVNLTREGDQIKMSKVEFAP
jgi:Mce-associated membrane protein